MRPTARYPFDDPRLQAQYQLVEELGQGGFAIVYRAVQHSTGQEVAVKLLEFDRHPSAPKLENQLERFRREARLCAKLHHPNVVPLVDFGETSSGDLFLVFSLIPGCDLAQILSREGALAPAEALHFMMQTLDALSCAHANGIVHRDLKPNNIMINTAGARRNAMVFDFGIGALPAEIQLAGAARLTERGEYMGTPLYSAPEQLRGEPSNVQSDVYAWGLVFVECLTGESAIAANTPQDAIHKQLIADPVALPVALEGHPLHELLRLATEKKLQHRQLNAAQMLRALQQIDVASLPSAQEVAAAGRSAFFRNPSPRPSIRAGSTWLVSRARNPHFVGRDEALERIAKVLFSRNQLPLIALHGMGGVGKSQLALEYAYRFEHRYSFVAWIRAEQPETLAADYAALSATLVGAPAEPAEQRQKIDFVRSYLERSSRWLIVFDNAPNPSALCEYLPRAYDGHIIVTSRHASWREVGGSLSVDVLDPDEALEFLARRTGDSDVSAKLRLSEELGRLPLALDEAAAYIEATSSSVEHYLVLLREQRARLLFGASAVSDDRVTLRTTWTLSFDAVARETPLAASFLNLCAFLDPDDVPFWLFRRGSKALPEALRAALEDDIAFDACLATLRRYSLVLLEADNLSLHRLVQLAVQQRLSDDERSVWAGRALAMVAEVYPWHAVTGAYYPESGRLLPHALSVLEFAEPYPQQQELAAALLRRTGSYSSARGQHEHACAQLEKARALLRACPAPDPVLYATALYELGMVLYALGEADQAAQALTSGLQKVGASAARGRLLQAQILLSLAWVENTLGHFSSSHSNAQQALQIVLARFDETHPVAASALAIIARAHWSLGMVDAATTERDRAALAIDRSSKPGHPLHVGACYMVAQLYLELNDVASARKYAVLGQAIGERSYGPDHILVCLNALVAGQVLLCAGNVAPARNTFERVIEVTQRSCRRLHEEFAIVRSELARAVAISGDMQTARRLLEHALDELPRLCGQTARVAGRAHLAMAEVLEQLGERASASEHAEAAVQVLAATFGSAHPLAQRASTASLGLRALPVLDQLTNQRRDG